MPDNFIVWSDVPPPAKLDILLNSADKQLDGIIASIKAKKSGKLNTEIRGDLYMPLAAFSTSKNTSRLHDDCKCIACGLCMEICPMRCIKKGDHGRPLWEGACTMCFACLHRCPVNAVQHGTDTQNKGRYVNPRVKLLNTIIETRSN
jgi:NAD-dependent dihydropyrimidine dehydrogenase PreA subunit